MGNWGKNIFITPSNTQIIFGGMCLYPAFANNSILHYDKYLKWTNFGSDDINAPIKRDIEFFSANHFYSEG